MSFLDTDIKYLKGVGDKRAQLLDSELDIRTFGDLLYTFPYRYVDTSRFYKISEFSGEMPSVQVLGRFVGFTVEGEGLRQRLKGSFYDGSRFMEVVWFSKVNFFKTAYQPGVAYILFGKPTQFRDIWQMAHPEVSAYDATRPPEGFRGVYTIPDKLRKKGYSTRLLSDLVKNLFNNARIGEVGETLPAEIIDKYSLMPLREALGNIHFPQNPDRLQKARERMKFEELFYLQLHILRYSRERGRRIRGHVLAKIGDYFNTYYSRHIPFELTGAQKRVLREIRNDMRTGRQMNRLLQGDVGSGKTMVAFMTMLMAADNGFQSAIMAPTEILASQHFETIRVWGEAIGLRVALLTGNTRAKARREIHEGLQSGDIDIIVGTHALIEDNVQFRNLGFVVIDEQHRFGVAQRARLWKKNSVPPHVLVMTATPIPRTLAMTVYGDLSVSVIDELPPGRKPVTTLLRYDDNREQVFRSVGRELAAGRQVYVVYPLIQENEKLDLQCLEEGYDSICETFPNYKVSFVHGRMKPAAKDYQMQQFASGEARILVATTVIEVGVNVPNASVMIIENAERFGLSQLHQLRGRVGRGAAQSFCILMSKRKIAADTRRRLEVMTSTTDGFVIAEADMKMRGPGDIEGTMQSGIAFDLKIADLARDGQIVELARREAEAMLDEDPSLSMPEHVVAARELSIQTSRAVDWSRIS